jgi:hypothetical protein
MKDEQESKEPIYQVGLDVRCRFTELARETVLYVSKDTIDNIYVERGNMAAHEARGVADMMVLLRNRISENKYHTFATVFETLYRPKPAVYKTLPNKLKEAIDCEASIRTLRPLKEGMNRPWLERQ